MAENEKYEKESKKMEAKEKGKKAPKKFSGGKGPRR